MTGKARGLIVAAVALILLATAFALIHKMQAPGSNLEAKIGQVLRWHWVHDFAGSFDSSWATYRMDAVMKSLYQHPHRYEDEIRSFLLQPHRTKMQKRVAVWALQCLELEHYIAFAEFVLAKVERREITRDVLAVALAPPPEWGTTFAMNHSHPAVVRLFERARKAGLPTETVDHVLSGTAKDYVDALNRAGEKTPRVECRP